MKTRRLRMKEAMALYDGLPPEGRAVAADYGMAKATGAYARTGDWGRARAFLTNLFGDPVRRRPSPVGSEDGLGGAL